VSSRSRFAASEPPPPPVRRRIKLSETHFGPSSVSEDDWAALAVHAETLASARLSCYWCPARGAYRALAACRGLRFAAVDLDSVAGASGPADAPAALGALRWLDQLVVTVRPPAGGSGADEGAVLGAVSDACRAIQGARKLTFVVDNFHGRAPEAGGPGEGAGTALSVDSVRGACAEGAGGAGGGAGAGTRVEVAYYSKVGPFGEGTPEGMTHHGEESHWAQERR